MRINHGTLWDARDLRGLRDGISKGEDLRLVAKGLGRSATACNARLVIIRTAILLNEVDGTTIRDIDLVERRKLYETV